MQKLAPWARGPFELIRHAEEHFKVGSDFDRRMALIGFDNAIEMTITTFLQLNPKLRVGQTYKRDDIQRWLVNYHSKIEFLEKHVADSNISLQSSIAEIIWYHTLRNELYHSGNGMVPEQESLVGARSAALEVFSIFFCTNTEVQFNTDITSPQSMPRENQNSFSTQTDFLKAFIQLEKTIKLTLLALGISSPTKQQSLISMWEVFISEAGEPPVEYTSVIQQAQKIRNEIVHNGYTRFDGKNVAILITELAEIADFIGNYGFSLDILSALKDRYSNWIQPNLQSVRIIQKKHIVFLETTKVNQSTGDLIETTQRVSLNHAIGELGGKFFTLDNTAQENAMRFVEGIDSYSLIMTGLGEFLFTQEGIRQIADLSKVDD